MNELIIKAENISKAFSSNIQVKNRVLNDIDLILSKREFAALIGPSGVGKSTLLYILGALEKPDQGDVSLFLNGKEHRYKDLNSSQLSQIRNKSIGFVFQFHHLLPEFSAIENVMIPAFIRGDNYNDAKKRASYLLERVGVLQVSNQKPSELSGGEQQRVAIARALINKPDLLIADEPTGNLDTNNAKLFLGLMKELKQEYSLSLIIATHSNEVASASDRIIRMEDGRIKQD
jgi:lipoprotein-releasing system ATP-binding protein